MSLHKAKLLGIGVTTDSKETILEEVRKSLRQISNPNDHPPAGGSKKVLKPFIIVTPNPEQVVLAQKDIHFRDILNQADVAIPDGVGLLAASQLLKSQIPSANWRTKSQTIRKRISGIELMEDLVEMAAKEGVKIALIGGRDGVAVKALECLRQRHHGLEGWAEEGPELEFEIRNSKFENTTHFVDAVVKKIITSNIQIVFVGFGAPKQEHLIAAISKQLSASSHDKSAESSKLKAEGCILMSVGGSFDEISGRIPRSPKIIDQMGLKWLWRFALEPWRWKRELSLLRFVWLVLAESVQRFTKKTQV